MISGYLTSKGIYHKIIELGYGVQNGDFLKLINFNVPMMNSVLQAYKKLPILDLKKYMGDADRFLLGGHMNLATHKDLAADIQLDLETNLK